MGHEKGKEISKAGNSLFMPFNLLFATLFYLLSFMPTTLGDHRLVRRIQRTSLWDYGAKEDQGAWISLPEVEFSGRYWDKVGFGFDFAFDLP